MAKAYVEFKLEGRCLVVDLLRSAALLLRYGHTTLRITPNSWTVNGEVISPAREGQNGQ